MRTPRLVRMKSRNTGSRSLHATARRDIPWVRFAMKTSIHYPTRPAAPAVVLATPWATDREYLRRLVKEHKMRPVEVGTCREALSAIGEFGATVVFCDEHLPWRDLLSYLAEDCSPPRVIVVGAAPCESLCADVIHLGGFDVVAKPFADEDIEWVLSSACLDANSKHPARRPATSQRIADPATVRAHCA
jgi:DNA-binding NtrC family response regulator